MISRKHRALKPPVHSREAQLHDEMLRKQFRDRVEECLKELEQDGLIYDTGQRRNGQIVYAAIPPVNERH